jgi:hypothetical protein
MHSNTLLSCAALAGAALSAPLTAPVTTSLTTRTTETWSIPTMDVHFMGRDTGIPGNTWPEDRKFNTTLDFTVIFPTFEQHCSANWTYQQVPTTKQSCGDDVTFQLSPTPAGAFSDSTWTLTIQEQDVNGYVYTFFYIFGKSFTNARVKCLFGEPNHRIK